VSHATTEDVLGDIVHVTGAIQFLANEARSRAHLNLWHTDRRKEFEREIHRKIRRLTELVDSMPTEEPR
jgi:hypothetical protein